MLTKLFANIKIKHKIILMPIIATIAFSSIVLFILYLNNRNEGLTRAIQNQYYPLLDQSRDLENMFNQLQRGLQDAVATADTTAFTESDTIFLNMIRHLQDIGESYPSEKKIFTELSSDLAIYYSLAREVSYRMITEETTEDLVAKLEMMTANYNRIKENFADTIRRYHQKISFAFEATRRNYQALMLMSIISTLSGIFLLAWISIILARSIIRPLNQVVAVAQEVGTGNFNVDLTTYSQDELGVLIKTFRSMVEKINHLIEDKDHAFNEVFIAKELLEQNARELEALNQKLMAEIKERQKAEKELNKHRYHLEELVEARTIELKKANEMLLNEINYRTQAEAKKEQLVKELESVNRELKDFAYVVSHDLKAPLRAIGSLSDWLITDYKDKLDEEGRELIQLLDSRVKRMHDLIEGILQYSRVGRVREEMVPVDLSRTVPEVIDLLSPPPHITVIVETKLPTITVEKTRIEQVFQNLISNAIKYMDKEKGEIRIGCEKEGDFWKFRVSDNGPGIEEKYFTKIFQIFQTLKPRDEYESTGVGLTLVKKIVEMYGGKIWLESEVGKGTTFYFTLPKTENVIEANGTSSQKDETASVSSEVMEI